MGLVVVVLLLTFVLMAEVVVVMAELLVAYTHYKSCDLGGKFPERQSPPGLGAEPPQSLTA